MSLNSGIKFNDVCRGLSNVMLFFIHFTLQIIVGNFNFLCVESERKRKSCESKKIEYSVSGVGKGFDGIKYFAHLYKLI